MVDSSIAEQLIVDDVYDYGVFFGKVVNDLFITIDVMKRIKND